MDAVTAYGLTKQFDGRTVLQELNLQIPQGAAMACAGQEGSGKTTLIRLLAGLCRPTAGECSVLGLSPAFETAKLHGVMGVVLETAPLYGSLTLAENLRFFAGLHNIDSNDALERSSFLLHKLGIWEFRDEKAGALPTGVARRASLARALMHAPRVLLMDEAARGLDAETAQTVQELLRYLVREEGIALLLGTRNMVYAQGVCDSFALLQNGVLIARGGLETLRQGAGVRLRAALKLGEEDAAPAGFQLREGFWQKEIDSEKEMPSIISQLVGQGRSLYEAKLIHPTLDEIYAAYLAGGRRREELAYGKQTDQPPEGPLPTAPAKTRQPENPEGAGTAGQPDGPGQPDGAGQPNEEGRLDKVGVPGEAEQPDGAGQPDRSGQPAGASSPCQPEGDGGADE